MIHHGRNSEAATDMLLDAFEYEESVEEEKTVEETSNFSSSGLLETAFKMQKDWMCNSIFWYLNVVMITFAGFLYLIGAYPLIASFIVVEYFALTYGFMFSLLMDLFEKSFFAKLLGAFLTTLYIISFVVLAYFLIKLFV